MSSIDIHQTTEECRICKKPEPELFCTSCGSKGVPYHEKCWDVQVLHDPEEQPQHRRTQIQDIQRLRYLDEPNVRSKIEERDFVEDGENCFVEFDPNSHVLKLGARASPLLRHDRSQSHLQYPSFVSFVGRTMNGKSFLLRALQHGAPDNFPSPIPAPGAKGHNHASTSSDINLYADWKTVNDESPILFLDCEGFEGSEVPTSLAAKAVKGAGIKLGIRRNFVDNAYPRFVYAFSTCVVFVTSGPLAESADIGRKLLSYATQGAGGSRNQGFKPSLFVVFNRFDGGNTSNFDWSIATSTEAFLKHDQLRDLELYYETIHVVYIPSVNTNKSDIALSQIDAFHTMLREVHARAFRRRSDFRLVFPPEKLEHFLWRALMQFSRSRLTVFNWSTETAYQRFQTVFLDAALHDLWVQYVEYYSYETRSARDIYRRTRATFEKHVQFCALISLVRNPPHGERIGTLPESLGVLVKGVGDLVLEFSPCGAVGNKCECDETRDRHGEHHQGKGADGKVLRWAGPYEEDKEIVGQTFRKDLEAMLKVSGSMPPVSLQTTDTLHEGITSVRSCFGCLQAPPSTTLACGHAFCSVCILDLAGNPEWPHRVESIFCPAEKALQRFSPRLLPRESGYRILSLDGGGVKGLAQLVILKHIETRCFNIPTTHLYDLIVGTSIGGQIALALTTASPSTPISVGAATRKFKQMMVSSFVPKRAIFSSINMVLNKTKYQATAVERQLKELFSDSAKLNDAGNSQSKSPPNVAVTTVFQEGLVPHIIANYNRNMTTKAIPLLLPSNAWESMTIWAAARSTSAALPYFKAFQWEGRTLLDGGFHWNCPAAIASEEAELIWPNKRRDLLLSLGTGMSSDVQAPTTNNILQVFKHVVEVVTSAEKLWKKFADSQGGDRLGQQGVFRLNPSWGEAEFVLDDYKRLDELERTTTGWLATMEPEITPVCDRLMAALFFFVPTSTIQNDALTGHIICRLPVDESHRQSLVEGMLQERDPNLFAVEFVNKNRDLVFINVERDLRDLRNGGELRIPVKLKELPYIGKIEVQITMRGITGTTKASSELWYPISGSPYVLREERLGGEQPRYFP